MTVNFAGISFVAAVCLTVQYSTLHSGEVLVARAHNASGVTKYLHAGDGALSWRRGQEGPSPTLASCYLTHLISITFGMQERSKQCVTDSTRRSETI